MRAKIRRRRTPAHRVLQRSIRQWLLHNRKEGRRVIPIGSSWPLGDLSSPDFDRLLPGEDLTASAEAVILNFSLVPPLQVGLRVSTAGRSTIEYLQQNGWAIY